MAGLLQQTILLLILLIFALRKFFSWRTTRIYRRLLQEQGCAEAPFDRNKLPGGIDHLWHLFMYRGADILEDVLIPRFHRLGTTFYEQLLGEKTFHTADPRNFQVILGTQWENFEVGPARRASFQPFLNGGMLCVDGSEWRHARELVKPSFARSHLNDYGITEKHFQNFLKSIPFESDSRWSEDVEALGRFYAFSMDLFTDFFFGSPVGAQRSNANPSKEPEVSDYESDGHASEVNEGFDGAFDLATEYTMQRSLLQGLYFLRDGSKYRKAVAIVHKYADHFVQKAIRSAKVASDTKQVTYRHAFINEIVTSTSNPLELRDSVLTLLLAGRDTTAGLLGWMIFFLARYPTVYEKLRHEILSRFNDTMTGVDYPQLKSIQYLQWVINETLRLHPVVSLTHRECVRDTILPTGGGDGGTKPVLVRKGEKIFLYLYVAHRSNEVWGVEAKDFMPERWAEKRIGWDFIPFGGGPRVCIGRKRFNSSP